MTSVGTGSCGSEREVLVGMRIERSSSSCPRVLRLIAEVVRGRGRSAVIRNVANLGQPLQGKCGDSHVERIHLEQTVFDRSNFDRRDFGPLWLVSRSLWVRRPFRPGVRSLFECSSQNLRLLMVSFCTSVTDGS